MIVLKIGRNEYGITSDDIFLDNGVCVQLLTQSAERSTRSGKPNPVLSKRTVEEISAYKRIHKNHTYPANAQVFSLNV